MKNQMSIDIAASKEKIWPFLVQTEKIHKWYSQQDKIEYVGQKQGEDGANLVLEEKFAGSNMKFDCQVIECRKNEKMVIKSNSVAAGLIKTMEQNWVLESLPSGTLFTFTELVKPRWGIVGAWMSILITPVAHSTTKKC
jgi:hypothetical protein